MADNSAILQVVKAEIQSVQTELILKLQEIQELEETLAGLRRLELRYSGAVPVVAEEVSKPLSLVAVLVETLRSSPEVHIIALRKAVVNAGIHTTDGTINTTLFELKTRGLVVRREGLRGVWRFFRPEQEVLRYIESVGASLEEPIGTGTLKAAVEERFPEAFKGVNGRPARFLLSETLQSLLESQAVYQNDRGFYMTTMAAVEVPRF